eukprot:scaffold15585_cov107-Isochrysis_galbana.AAC.2
MRRARDWAVLPHRRKTRPRLRSDTREMMTDVKSSHLFRKGDRRGEAGNEVTWDGRSTGAAQTRLPSGGWTTRPRAGTGAGARRAVGSSFTRRWRKNALLRPRVEVAVRRDRDAHILPQLLEDVPERARGADPWPDREGEAVRVARGGVWILTQDDDSDRVEVAPLERCKHLVRSWEHECLLALGFHEAAQGLVRGRRAVVAHRCTPRLGQEPRIAAAARAGTHRQAQGRPAQHAPASDADTQ